MSELLFEIGCEELPAAFVGSTLSQLEKLFVEKFAGAALFEAGTAPTSLQIYGTPRRLVILASGIRLAQQDETLEIKGPAEKVAFDGEGLVTRAAQGFAAKNGIAPSDLGRKDGYVYATVQKQGRPTTTVAAELLYEIVAALTFPKSMRWGTRKFRFARPIRWLVALLDNETIPVQIEHVTAGTMSRGHRFLSPDDFSVGSSSEYLDGVRAASVILDQEERRSSIQTQIEELARAVDGEVIIDPDLLDENVYLTEFPTAVLGSFEDEFLSLPRPVLVTAMRKHQRYFPIVDNNGKLLPKFVAVRNGGGEYLDVVRTGFECVLRARFADAKFFFDLDVRTSLASKRESTETIVFNDKLGSVRDKSDRLIKLVNSLDYSSLSIPVDVDALRRAAYLCKVDLATEMVKELPSLQGIVGEHYAEMDGEPLGVASAISGHYQPKGSGDSLPKSIESKILALLDRVDTLVGYLSLGIMPTGTSDPYGLRRAATGVVQLLHAIELDLPFGQLVTTARQNYTEQGIVFESDEASVQFSFQTLLVQRISTLLEDEGVDHDVRECALATDFDTVHGRISLARAVRELKNSAEIADCVAVTVRIGNLLRFAAKDKVSDPVGPIDQTLLSDATELELNSRLQEVGGTLTDAAANREWKSVIAQLAAMRPPVDAFFGAIMVMGDDIQLRNNRLRLLDAVYYLFDSICDFERLTIAETANAERL